MRIDACRTCGAPIIWANTENGKWMPVTAEPEEGGNVRLEDRKSKPPLAVVVPAHLRVVPLRTSHFYPCPDADLHRKRDT